MLERARNLDRRGVPREQRMAEHMREVDRRAASLPPRPVSESAADEIHMLCGRKHLGMGCLALWSFLRWIPFDVAVYVHSDGTTTPEDVQTWRSRFPNLNVVLPEEMKPLRDELLERGPYPYLRKFADVNLYTPKLIDFHLAGRGDRIVMLDSDVLYFQWPDELLRAWEAARPGRERIFTTFNDIFDAYFVPLNEVEQVVGRRPLERFNAGMTIAPKFTDADFRDVESIMARILQSSEEHLHGCYTEQTIYAILAAEGKTHRLGDDYIIGGLAPKATAVHFAGHFRELYYTEGVPRVLTDVTSADAARATG